MIGLSNSTDTIITAMMTSSFAIVCVLIVLLVLKVLTTTAKGFTANKIGKYLNMGIFPLLVVFMFIVITTVLERLK